VAIEGDYLPSTRDFVRDQVEALRAAG